MNHSTHSPDLLLRALQCLSDPIRLRLLRLLEDQELGVAELRQVLQLPQSTVSRHLKILLEDNWVRSRRQATAHYYRASLDQQPAPAKRLWQLARDQVENWAAARQDQLRLQRVLRQRRADPEAFFAGAATQWDKLRRQLYGQSFIYDALLALLPGNLVIADLGCGTGTLITQLAAHVDRVIGIDSSAAMLRAARRRVAEFENVQLHRADLASLPLTDRSCDGATLILVLSYIADLAAVLREARRILKPTGKLIIVDLLPHDRDDFRRQMNQAHLGLDPEQLGSTLRTIGFASTTVRPLASEPQAQGPALFLAVAT